MDKEKPYDPEGPVIQPGRLAPEGKSNASLIHEAAQKKREKMKAERLAAEEKMRLEQENAYPRSEETEHQKSEAPDTSEKPEQ